MNRLVLAGRRASTALAVAVAAVFASSAEAEAPTSIADLATPLLPAVVTVSAYQIVTSGGATASAAAAQQQEGSPFPELFKDFFDQPTAGTQSHLSLSLGSGFVVDPTGIIVTNNHVVEGADRIVVHFTDTTSALAKVLGVDDKTDIAVLQVNVDHPLATVSFGDSKSVRIGDWVMAVGNPFGFGGSVTLGIVSAKNRDISSGPYDAYIQTDAAINKGNSGGPLFDMDGKVIGIDTAIVSPSGGSIGIGFAIPAEIAAGVVDQLWHMGATHRGYLGVRIQTVTSEIAQGTGLPSPSGVLVAGVDDPGPAADAGIMAGDVILSFAGVAVDAEHDLPRLVADQAVGSEVPVVVFRNGMAQALTVKLGQLQDSPQVAAAVPSKNSPSVLTAPGASTNAPSSSGATPVPVVGTNGPLGLTLTELSKSVRDKLGLSAAVTEGVPVIAVEQNSAAEMQHIQAGDVIVQIDQQVVTSPDDVSKKIEALKNMGLKSAQLVIQNSDGYVRFASVAIQ